MVSFKVLNYFHVSLYSKFDSKLTTALGHSEKHQTNGPKVEMDLFIKLIVHHFVAYECTFLTMYNNQMKSKQIQRNVGKIGVPELHLHRPCSENFSCFILVDST